MGLRRVSSGVLHLGVTTMSMKCKAKSTSSLNLKYVDERKTRLWETVGFLQSFGRF